ncbi:MAG: Bax inhibitor-1/YccA family protein [Desulfovibrionaceae bacterium]|nr:Bax inhibitor-1/YccA family protein [Desulfovibrionaceae bacterium]
MVWNNNTATLPRSESRVEVMNAFMRSIYNWMTLGLGLTAVISCAITYTSLGPALYQSGGQMLYWGTAIGAFVIALYLQARIQKLSASAAAGFFVLYSALNGIWLSYVLAIYTPGSVASAFVATAGMFGAMSLYGLFTKKDLTSWGSFLFMGLIGIIIAMLVNLFLQSNMMTTVISVIGVFIFCGLTAYDTQLFREMGENIPQNDATAVRRGVVIGALHLYLNFLNLFLMLLRLMGNRN